MSYYEAAVERGMKFLDDNLPGWENDIDLDKLNMSSHCNCVVGQLLDYYSSLHKVFPNAEKGSYYGFDLPADIPYNQRPFVENQWTALEDIWKEKIEARVAVTERELVAV